ncbi:MAG TPA: glucuronate isomerase [Bryobacteraceae bacterium]|nr:glucuronate isomerase [Bryobacteraceae bacterium]
MTGVTADAILPAVEQALAETPFIDIHTHLFAPSFGRIGLWGIDELLTYHYLEAELFRSSPITPDEYFAMDKRAQADVIWRALFVENTPVSESARGVIAVLSAFGLSTGEDGLDEAREFFREQNLNDHISRVFRLAGISEAVMTNDPADPVEGLLWETGVKPDARFHPVLRLDRILGENPPVGDTRKRLAAISASMRPVYMAISLADTFTYPSEDPLTPLFRDAVLPCCREFDIPLSLMIGVRRQVNPAIRLAGDAVGRADLRAVETLCREFPDNRFLVSVLSRENQHELCVYARKFRNLMPFGCWWFLNNPSIVEEITRERLEMLGASFIPQHSDARILEQVIYKWRNTRRTLAPILANTYRLLAEDGRPVTKGDIRRDVERLFRGNFESWTNIVR